MKTTPFPHQQAEIEEHGTDLSRAIFHEQGTGKSLTALACAEKLRDAGKINAVLILAPNGLHTNWVKYEIPAHLEEAHTAVAFLTHRASTKKHKRECEALFRGGFPILAVSYDAIKTVAGKKLVNKFLRVYNCFIIADESNRFKTPSAAITRSVLGLSKLAQYKRILCGTPITNSPFDLYTQFRFLDPSFWARTRYGLSDFQSFKTFFGEWEEGYNGKTDTKYKVCTAYKNLHILKELVSHKSTRVLKADVLKDLPDKLYSYRSFEMSPAQQRIYDQIETEFMAELNGELIFTPLAITRMLRLQQVLSGYLPSGDEGDCVLIDPKNPRLKLLAEICEDIPHQAIVWARFIKDIDLICEKLGDRAARWDGSTPPGEREEGKDAFKRGDKQFLVATPDSMGEGHTLNEAVTAIYYSNSYKLKERLQSEDRCHRLGQKNAVHYIDIVADNSMDRDIIEALRRKFDSASLVIDGKVRKWLTQYGGCGIMRTC